MKILSDLNLYTELKFDEELLLMNSKYKSITVSILLPSWILLISFFIISDQHIEAIGVTCLPLVALACTFLLKKPHWALAGIGLSYILNRQFELGFLTSNIMLVAICLINLFVQKKNLRLDIDIKYFASLVLFISYVLISYFVTHGNLNYYDVNNYLNNIAIFLFIYIFFDNYNKISIFLNMIVVSSLILFASGIFQLVKLGSMPHDYMTGYFSNHVMYGLHIAFGAIFSFFFYRETKSKLYLLCTIALVCGVLLAFSRGVILALIFSIIFFVGANYVKKSKHKKILNLTMLVVFLLGTGVIYHQVITKIEYGTSQERVTSGRSLLYQAAWKAFKASPYLGVGWDNYKNVWSDFVSIPYQRWGTPVTEKKMNTHSSYLKILSELGLIGGVLFLFVHIFLLKSLYPVFFSSEGFPLFMVLLLFYFIGITDNNSYGNDRMFYFTTGLLFSIKTLKQKEEKKPNAHSVFH